MNRFTAFVFCGSMVATIGCNGDDVDLGDKAIIDADRLEEGWTVQLSGATGRVEVPFLEPLPGSEDDDEDIQRELDGAVELVVQSKATGTTADLRSGELVDGTPNDAGEYSWSLNDDRDVAELTFYNETPGGYTLKSTSEYEAQLSVSSNDYVEGLDTITFDIDPR